MVKTKVLSHSDLNTPHEKPIYIPRVPLALRIPIFVWLMQEPHRNAAGHCGERCISVTLVRNAIHDYVDLLRFLVEI
jgi:hypothetical protein